MDNNINRYRRRPEETAPASPKQSLMCVYLCVYIFIYLFIYLSKTYVSQIYIYIYTHTYIMCALYIIFIYNSQNIRITNV